MSNATHWTPFNSDKLLAHVPRWSRIAEGEVPVPCTVSLDPSATCNLRCIWCNGRSAMTGFRYSDSTIDTLPKKLADWGVPAVCVGGGGEPTTHPRCDEFICRLAGAGMRVGIVTNGVLGLSDEAAAAATWVGVSVDAGTAKTFKKLKGVDAFDVVIGRLRPGWTMKYLVHPENVSEIPIAARLAKQQGCRWFQARPVSSAWFEDVHYRIRGLEEAVAEASELADDDFGVVCVTEKVKRPTFPFARCHAIFMGCVLTPHPKGFNIELCCDRRGDRRLLLAEGVTDFAAWGSEKHRAVAPDLSECPRCTCQPHNVIYEQVIEKDLMTWQFA